MCAPRVCLTPRSQCQHLISTICKWTGAGPEGQSTNWRQNNSTMVHLFVYQRDRERVCVCVCPNACLELCDCLCVVTWLWVSAMCPYPNSGAICGSAYTSQLLNNHDLINPVMKGWILAKQGFLSNLYTVSFLAQTNSVLRDSRQQYLCTRLGMGNPTWRWWKQMGVEANSISLWTKNVKYTPELPFGIIERWRELEAKLPMTNQRLQGAI